MNYIELREKYPEFIYQRYQIDETETMFHIQYHFTIVGLDDFYPTWSIEKKKNDMFSTYKNIQQLVFHLGLVEMMSYWKLVCSETITIRCGLLNNDQIAWWKKLFYHGLGEFFYINNITVNMDDFVTFICTGEEIVGEDYHRTPIGNLIPIGGGKDSLVSLVILEDEFKDNDAFIINKVPSALACAKASGYQEKTMVVQRTLDKKMLAYNKQGFLNGHTPFSAIVAFSSMLVGQMMNKKYIILSNEASANESTVSDDTVNHQYSKSFEFEHDFNQYIHMYINCDPHYFSLLRGCSELQITSIFAKQTQYHLVFRSCNVGSKEGVWCGKCAKCLFVAVMLSAFISDEAITTIMNHDILNDESLYPLLRQLSGLDTNKPFECVGTRSEVQEAIYMSCEKRCHLPRLYWMFLEESTFIREDVDFRNAFNDVHEIPEHLVEKVKNKIKDCWHDNK